MSKRKIFHHIFPLILVIIVASAVASDWFALAALRNFQHATTRGELETKARMLTSSVATRLHGGDIAELRAYCAELAKLSSSRLTIVDPAGKVLADSEEDPARMMNHNDRPEIKEAFAGKPGQSVRYSPTLGQNMMYVALPLVVKGEAVGALRLSVSLASVEKARAAIRLRVIAVGFLVALLAAAASYYVSRRIVRPIEELMSGAERFAAGDFARRTPTSDIEEVGALSETMNYMAEQLDQRIAQLTSQRNQLDSILASMTEGVIAVDAEEKVILVNAAAAGFFKILTKPEGRLFHEVVRNPGLQCFMERILAGQEAGAVDVSLFNGERAYAQARGSLLKGADGKGLGAVVVFSDVTRIKRLENLRSEFVANVSHEIKTPLSAIKAAVETLLTDREIGENDRGRFLDIIARHTDRLDAMVKDILSLSVLEQPRDKVPLSPREVRPSQLLDAVMELCKAKAEGKHVVVARRLEVDPTIMGDVTLLEQALSNLLDNAIKYSDDGGQVEIGVTTDGGSVRITVADHGCGISAEHLPRIFERFYRVDKARSRKLGGTGLGLAIVKHTVLAHGGEVKVESEVGKGSRFTLSLPLQNEAEMQPAAAKPVEDGFPS